METRDIFIACSLGVVVLVVLLTIFLPLFFKKIKNDFTGVLVSWCISIGLIIVGAVFIWIGAISVGGRTILLWIEPFVVFAGMILAFIAVIKTRSRNNS